MKKLLRFFFSKMNAFAAYPAGEVQAVFAFLGGNVLIKDFPRSFPNAAFEKPFLLQSGEIAINGADADVVCRQCVGDLPRGHLFVCML